MIPEEQVSDSPANADLDEAVLSELREVVGWDSDLSEIVATFLTQTETLLEDLRAAARLGDGNGLAQSAHSLKGSSSYLGARRMTRLCEELEALAREEAGGEPIVVLLDEVELEFGLVRLALPAALSVAPE